MMAAATKNSTAYVDPTYLGDDGYLRCHRHHKVLHERAGDAHEVIERLGCPDLVAYRCWTAGWWHIGHATRPSEGHRHAQARD